MLKIECNMKLEQTTTKNKYKIKYLYIREFIYICYFYWRRIFFFIIKVIPFIVQQCNITLSFRSCRAL